LVIAVMTLRTLGQNLPSNDTLAVLALFPNSSMTNFLDGPGSVSHQLTTPTTNSEPSLQDLIYYNYYAAAVYCVDGKGLNCSSCQNFKNDIYNYTVLKSNSVDTLALITLSFTREEIVVTYRGTANIWNWILDFTAITFNYPSTPSGIKLHLGFYVATLSLYNDVVTNVGFLLTYFPNYKLKIIGHSLGGAMARLTEFFILVTNQFPGTAITVITYGEPRSGNIPFVNYMNFQNITTARVVNKADIVSHVAPTSVFGTTAFGNYYVQCQTEYWINVAGKGNFCSQNYLEDPNCSDSLGPAYSILDHTFYFDADYYECAIDGYIAPIPTNIIPIVATIPPQPNKIFNFSSASNNFVF